MTTDLKAIEALNILEACIYEANLNHDDPGYSRRGKGHVMNCLKEAYDEQIPIIRTALQAVPEKVKL